MYFKLHSACEGKTLIRKVLIRIHHNVSDILPPPPSFFKEVKHKYGICI